MKNPLLPALILVGALVGGARADAQRPEGLPAAGVAPAIVHFAPPAAIDLLTQSAAVPPAARAAAFLAAGRPIGRSAAPSTALIAGPVAAPPTAFTRAAALDSPEPRAPAPAAAGVRMPASRVLIFGGTAAAVAGLLIGGDAGAIVAITGTTAAIYGLYLHYR